MKPSTATRASAVALLLLVVGACGGRARSVATAGKGPSDAGADASVHSASIDAGAVDGGADGAPLPPPSARGEELAPTMRAVADKSGEVDAKERFAITGAAHDACVRVAFSAEKPVRAVLETERGVVAATGPAKQGALGERGPVCVRKGDGLRLRFELEGRARIAWAAWESP